MNISKDIEIIMEPKMDTETEENGNHYIHQLTMQTMVNRDILRKINERKQLTNCMENKNMTLRQLQDMVKELWEVTQTKEFSLDMNSSYPYELQKSFDQFVGQSRIYLEKHPNFMLLPIYPTIEKEKEQKGEDDTKEIHMSPIFMEKKHPLWNYNHFNRKNAIHAYPPTSQYHIPTSSHYRENTWRKGKIPQEDMLFAENDEEL
jgi:hypothetical protein